MLVWFRLFAFHLFNFCFRFYLTSLGTLILGLFLLLNAPIMSARYYTMSCITLHFDVSCNRPFFASFYIWLENRVIPDDLRGKVQLNNRNAGRQQATWHQCMDYNANFLKFNTLDIYLSTKNQTCVEPWNYFDEVLLVEHQIDTNHTYLVKWDMNACAEPQVIEIE